MEKTQSVSYVTFGESTILFTSDKSFWIYFIVFLDVIL